MKTSVHDDRKERLLRTFFSVSSFLLAERDLPSLLQGVCDRLTGESLNRAAWIVLFEEEEGGVITSESGLTDRFDRMMSRLRNGLLPRCGSQVLSRQNREPLLCRECDCGVCEAADSESGCMAGVVAIRCEPGLSGFLVVLLPESVEPDREELGLLQELADSIGYALRHLFGLEELKQREAELLRVEKRFEQALTASQAGLWDWNIRTGEMYTAPAGRQILNYQEASDGEETGTWQSRIHPDDRSRVLEEIKTHLTSRDDKEYQIEYRVRGEDGQWRWFLDRGRVVERDEQGIPVRMTGTHQDITLQKQRDETMALMQEQMHRAIEHERSFLQSVIDGAADPVMVIDMEYTLQLINAAACRLMQVDQHSAEGKKCYQLFSNRDRPCSSDRYPCPIQEIRKTGRRVTLIHNPFHGNRINNTFEIEASPFRDREGNIHGVVEVARDITDRLRIEKELRESQSRLYKLAHHDTLTGLPNRLLFRDRLERALAKAQRKKSRVAILFLDLDHFKEINDTLGHDVGDGLLVEVANRLQQQCRRSDTVARLGGDEFVFILDEISRAQNAAIVATKIMASLDRPIRVGEHDLRISTSIGIGIYPDDSDKMDEVIKCADTALYRAKEEGRSNFKFYTPSMNSRAYERQRLEQELRLAVTAGEFFLEYQPQYQMQGRKLVGFEALLRWNHPDQGVVPPDEFIPLAEKSGLIVEIGEWVLHSVCRQIVAWQNQGLSPLPVAVNIATRQFRADDFLPMVARIVRDAGLSPDMLEIELLEAAVMEKVSQSDLELEKIARIGIRLVLDDFGTGYSSLAQLQRFPLSRLKIDQSFVRDVPLDRNMSMLVQAIIVLAHSLGLTVLAEGVENGQQIQFLEQHGCDQVQGFYLARPMAADEASRLLADVSREGTG